MLGSNQIGKVEEISSFPSPSRQRLNISRFPPILIPGTMVISEGAFDPMVLMEDFTTYELPWETLEAIILGKSSIDLTTMPTQDRSDAYNLVYHYGYDLDLLEDKQEVGQLYQEAIEFIEQRLLDPNVRWQDIGEPLSPVERIPSHITESRDMLDLIMTASQGPSPDRYWACSLLKVIHTLAHVHNKPFFKYFQEASDIILARFHNILTPQEDGSFLLQGSQHNLKLYGFETKYQKPRESILIKLLCKKENVAEDIWDLVGVRLITHHPAEAILAIDILREQKVLVFPNIIPSRSRNTLLDFNHFKEQYTLALGEYAAGRKTTEEMRRLFETLPIRPAEENAFKDNPSSSSFYRSIHITCRHLLRLGGPEASQQTRFAFPYEIQIQDLASYLENKEGNSAHGMYKLKQLGAARRRVLGLLLSSKYPNL